MNTPTTAFTGMETSLCKKRTSDPQKTPPGFLGFPSIAYFLPPNMAKKEQKHSFVNTCLLFVRFMVCCL